MVWIKGWERRGKEGGISGREREVERKSCVVWIRGKGRRRRKWKGKVERKVKETISGMDQEMGKKGKKRGRRKGISERERGVKGR